MHPGKAGGGTFQSRSAVLWDLKIHQCHPHPCHEHVLEKRFGANVNTTKFVVAIRDPIDRYVSAFYWRHKIVCNPYREGKKEKGCQQNSSPLEKDALFHTYNDDASALAEDLCSLNEAVAQEAWRMLRKIRHAQDFLAKWLDFDWNPENMFGIVLEKGNHTANLEFQVDLAIEWIYSKLAFESSDDFANRISQKAKREGIARASRLHSSAGEKRALSPEAFKCLAMLHKRDYEALREQKHHLCKTDECVAGIDSILNRRETLLADVS